MKTGPRTYSLGGGISALNTITLGGNGVLPGGTYFLAITSGSATFASTFSAFSTGIATSNTAQLNFRTNGDCCLLVLCFSRHRHVTLFYHLEIARSDDLGNE